MSKREKRQSRILDECLDSIWTGEDSAGNILRQFPSEEQELRRMLSLAVEVRDCLAPDYPKPRYVGVSRRRVLLNVAHQLYRSTFPKQPTKPARRWKPAQVFISLVLAIAILATSTVAVRAANAALPGDPLYAVKRGLENLRLAVTWSPSGDMRLLVQFAGTRLAELEALLAANRHGDLALALEGFEESLFDLTSLAGEAGAEIPTDTLDFILDRLAHLQEGLDRVSAQVPAEVQPAIQLAMGWLGYSQGIIQQLRQDDVVVDLPPDLESSPTDQQPIPPSPQHTPTATASPAASSTSTSIPTATLTPTPTPVPPTPTPTEVPTMHVKDIDAQIVGGPSNREVWVTISIATNSDSSVDGATVMGTWTASGEGVEYSCVTIASGKCTIRSGILLGIDETTFTVTNVIHTSYLYAPGDNSDPDGDSDGTIITIELPN